MEPGDRDPAPLNNPSRLRSATRLLAGCAALVGLCFLQSPGFLAADTKFDLVLDPQEFLSRALWPWDGEGALGQLQNQAYGYLWPIGPFFWAGAALSIPAWAIQRLWWGLVLSVAFVGAALVCRRLGARSDLACLLGGFGYALAPRMLTTLGPISIEAWPAAIAPWVLLPLMIGSERGSARRAAAWSALAVGCVGGVNAVASAGVLPLGALWILTRERGVRKRRLLVWWPVFTAVATLWWVIPLLLLGRYSPPFLEYIESAAVTTLTTTPYDVLRGTTAWVPYVEPGWQAGADLIRLPHPVLNSGLLLMVGLAGLILPRTTERVFLIGSVVAGFVLVSVGHLGPVQGWFAPELHQLLDRALAPMRNVHKFDPVLRLPLAVGVALAIEQTGAASVWARRRGWSPRRALALTVVVGILGASTPALFGRLVPANPVLAVPDYWTQAADWLGQRSQSGAALLIPGSSFGTYEWGSPHDEPLQALASGPWAVRNAIPLTPPANILMLDAVETRLAQGRGSIALAPYLRRAGIGYLVVRNDLSRNPTTLNRTGDIPPPALVHQALRSSPGITPVVGFGPPVGGPAAVQTDGGRQLVEQGWRRSYPSIEIYRVQGASASAEAGADPPLTLVGGPAELLDLIELDLLDSGAVQLAADLGDQTDQPPGPWVLTDGLVRRERNYGRIHDAESAARLPDDSRRTGNRLPDYTLPGADRWTTWMELEGVRSVTASSSNSDATTLGESHPGESPWAALDGYPGSEWVSGEPGRQPTTWQVNLADPVDIVQVILRAGESAGSDQRVRVVTANGASEEVRTSPGAVRIVRVPRGETDWIRVEEASGDPARGLALAEVSWAGRLLGRTLVLPEVPDSWGPPAAVVLRALADYRTGCVRVSGAVRCAQGKDRVAEEPTGLRRRFRLPEGADYQVRLRVQPRAGRALEKLLQSDRFGTAFGSSAAVADIRSSAMAAIDGNPRTTWTALQADIEPALDLRWLGKRRVRGLRLTLEPGAAARLPTRVEVSWPHHRVTRPVGADGRVDLPPFRADGIRIKVLAAEPGSSLELGGRVIQLGVGISEIRVEGVRAFPEIPAQRKQWWPCGTGPLLSVNGRLVPTRLRASARQLAAMRRVSATPCSSTPITLAGGENLVEVANTDSIGVLRVSMVAADPSPDPAVPVPVTWTDPVTGELTAPPGTEVVALPINANPGWQATQDGRRLSPMVVDGWRQAFRVDPDATGPIKLRFAAAATHRWALILGGLAVLALAIATSLNRLWRDRADPVAAGRISWFVVASATVLFGGLIGGWWGFALGVVALLVHALAQDQVRRLLPWVTGMLPLIGACWYALAPWGSEQWAGSMATPSYLALAAVLLVAAAAVESPARWRNRLAGRSTRR